ncbi:MAG: ribosome recycling factor [Candidatus Paceibacterota bacterium]
MAYDFSEFKKRGEEIKSWLDKEFAGIRTGRATPAILDGVSVEVYGSKMPLNQVANITIEDPRTLAIIPWDSSIVKNIEKALRNSDLGLSVNVADTSIRVIFPELNYERRQSLAKVVRQREEQAKVSLRNERERVWDDIQERFREGEITEDDKFRSKDDLQKHLNDLNKDIEAKADKKEKEVKEN